MSSEEEEVRQYVSVRAPVTVWEFFLRVWWVVLLFIGVIVFVIIRPTIPISFQFGYWAFIGCFIIVYLKLGSPIGWALDTTDMENGEIGLWELNKYQLDRVATKPTVMMFNSQSGVVALVGHGLVSKDDSGELFLHPPLELKTNSNIARSVAASQKNIIDEYLMLKNAPELEAYRLFKEMYDGWKKKTRQDPESSDTKLS